MKTTLTTISKLFLYLIALLLTAYAAGAIYFCLPVCAQLRLYIVSGFLLLCLLALVHGKTCKTRLFCLTPLLLIAYLWYFSLEPKADAPWSPDVAVLPHVQLNGDLLSVQNIRNFKYRSDTDFDVRYYDKVFDLSKLQSADLFLSYWGSRTIAHTIVSFGFSDNSQLAVSIETRKEIGEQYSAVEGFFNKFELIYVLADERDLIGVRVNHRNENVYLYRMKRLNPEETKKLLLAYVSSVQSLERKPKFYNALTANCTTSIIGNIRQFTSKLHFNFAMIANGYIDRWRYDEGVWGFKLPFEEFRRQSNIDEKVKAAGDSEDFSVLIRKGVPSIEQ